MKVFHALRFSIFSPCIPSPENKDVVFCSRQFGVLSPVNDAYCMYSTSVSTLQIKSVTVIPNRKFRAQRLCLLGLAQIELDGAPLVDYPAS